MIVRQRGETLTLAATAAIGFAQIRNIPPGFNMLEVDVPSATLEDILLAFGPRIMKVIYLDASGLLDFQYFDLTDNLLDRNTLTGTGAILNSMTTSDFIYICLSRSASGLAVDITNVNGNIAVATYSYLDVGGVWTDLAATDGTAAAGAMLAVDGLVTWTVPNPELWVARKFYRTDIPAFMKGLHGYWVRIATSATLDATVSLVALSALANINVDTVTAVSGGEARIRIQTNNRGREPSRFRIDLSKYGSMELTSTTIVTAANLNWLEEHGR